MHRRTGNVWWRRLARGAGVLGIGIAAAGSTAAVPVGAAAGGVATERAVQEDLEAMVAAARWVLDRVPSGSVRVDPHRTGESRELARRVAGELGASLATLEDTRVCENTMDESSCHLAASALLAISAPVIDGREARVRIYAWHRTDDARRPVAQRSWTLVLRREAGRWQVVGQRRAGLS